MLKKEFNKKDVNRARNLIMGKTGDSTGVQIGYTKKIIERKEGDVWVENEKTWTIKNGIRRTISQLSAIKKEIHMPLCCPKCNNVMKSQFDKPNYRIHKKCTNCVIDFEGKLKHVPGRYEKYLKELELKNQLTMLDSIESELLDLANTSNTGYITEKGEQERWVGGMNAQKVTKDIKKHVKKQRKKLEKELNESEFKKSN